MAGNSLSQEKRLLLNRILDQLIPGNPERDIPGAGEIGVADYLFRTAKGKPEFDAVLRRLLARAEGLEGDIDPTRIGQLERAMPHEFIQVLTETYKGYYSLPDMRSKVGVGAHPIHPKGYEVAPESAELIDGLTEPVRARGPIYRDLGVVGDG